MRSGTSSTVQRPAAGSRWCGDRLSMVRRPALDGAAAGSRQCSGRAVDGGAAAGSRRRGGSSLTSDPRDRLQLTNPHNVEMS